MTTSSATRLSTILKLLNEEIAASAAVQADLLSIKPVINKALRSLLVEAETKAPTPVTETATAVKPVHNFKIGDKVILGKHIGGYAGSQMNWTDEMDQYVGKTAIITTNPVDDWCGKSVVGVDTNRYQWRTENMTPVVPVKKVKAVKSKYEFQVGDKVILGKHQFVNGTENWNCEMEKYVGKTATITRIDTPSFDKCKVVRVDTNEYQWRTENMKLVKKFKHVFNVGDKVILGKHKRVKGSTNWCDSMDAFVGKTATITQIDSKDFDGNINAYVDTNTWQWRTENMKLAS